MTRLAGIPVFQRFFRSAASLDIDKQDIRRYREFVDTMVDEFAVAGRNAAKWNGRDVIAPADLPITKALQERMREFKKLDGADEIQALLGKTLRRPPDGVTFGEDTEELLPELFGGLSVALARSFRLVEPTLANPRTEHWQRAFDLFQLVI